MNINKATLENVSQFQCALESFYNRNSEYQVYSVANLDSKTLTHMIENGNLQFVQTDDFVAIIKIKNQYFRVYSLYSTCKIAKGGVQKTLNKPVVIDIIGKEHTFNHHVINWLKHCGFKKYKQYLKMRYVYNNNLPKVCRIRGLTPVTEGLKAREIFRLWHDNLDKYTIDLPDEAQISNLLNNQEIIGICNEYNDLCAAIHLKKQNSKYSIQHVVTDQNYRNRGYSKYLVSYAINNTGNKKGLVELWVENENFSARHLYESVGFVYTDFLSVQYVLD